MAGQDFLEDENDQTSDILSMQVQLVRGFMARHQLDKWAALKLFQEHDLFGFVSECYGLLSLSGDEYILDDMDKILVHHGVTL